MFVIVKFAEDETKSQHIAGGGNKFQSPSVNDSTKFTEYDHFTCE